MQAKAVAMSPNQEMDGHVGSAPTIPVWKTGVCLSTLTPDEMACQP
jgi:hypothetical protein